MAAGLEDLAPITILDILEMLSLRDIISLKQTCKQLASIINRHPRLKCLVVARSEGSQPSYRKWFCTYEPVSCRVLLTAPNSRLLDSNRILFAAIKRLFIFEHEISISQLNSFKELSWLEFEEANLIADQAVLDLPCLLHLKLCYYNAFDGVTLKTPNLRKLCTSSFNFRLLYPQSIAACQIKFYDPIVKSMTNLTHLYCDRIRGVCSDLITTLPELQELHIVDDAFELGNLIEQMRRAERTTPQVFYNGAQVNNLLTLRVAPASTLAKDVTKMLEKFQSDVLFKYIHPEGAQLAEVMHFIHAIRYCDLEEAFNLRINDELTKRFANLENLIISDKVQDIQQLNQFLADCSLRTNLRAIFFDQAALDQSFFHALPELLPALSKLTIVKMRHVLNFYFLLRFAHNLHALTVDQELPPGLIVELMKKNKDLSKVEFKYKRKSAKVFKWRFDEFYLQLEAAWYLTNCLDDLGVCLESMKGTLQPAEPERTLKPERVFNLVEGIYQVYDN